MRTWHSTSAAVVQNRLTFTPNALSNRFVVRSSARGTSSSTSRPDSRWSTFRERAREIAVADRSMAVRHPPARQSQTSAAATPVPQPSSSTRSAGATSRRPRAHSMRAGTSCARLAMPGRYRPAGIARSAPGRTVRLRRRGLCGRDPNPADDVEDDGIMVLRYGRRPVDLTQPISCEPAGDDW